LGWVGQEYGPLIHTGNHWTECYTL
jgi:hypothetical protein